MKIGLAYLKRNSFVAKKGKTTILYIPKRFISAHKMRGGRLTQFKKGFILGAKRQGNNIHTLRVVGFKHTGR